MEKSRVIAQMEILEKLLTSRNSFKTKEDEVVHYRNVTSKILSLLEGSDQVYRDVIIKTPSQVDALISALHTNMDSQVVYTVVKIINELVGRSNAQKRAQILVHHGATRALLQCIYMESKETIPCDDYLFLLHQVLFRIGVKDKKLGVRARLSQCLPVIVSLLRAQVNLVPHARTAATAVSIPLNLSKNITTLLNIARLYSHNLINASRLGRNGLIGVLLKIISYSGKNNVSLLRINLETLNLCVRTKSNGARAVNHGAMAMLLQLFMDWNRIDSRDKQLALRRCILNVVKNLINLRAGRKAFLEADGLHTFYGYCEACKFQNSVESIVTLASLILRKCFPKNRLPLSHYDSTLRCPLPNSGAKDRSKYLLELRKGLISPIAPRSTSPIDVLPIIPFLGCQGDYDTLINQKKQVVRDRSLESIEFHQDYDAEDNLYIDAAKDNNRLRAKNLFRSLDKKLSESHRKGASQMSHQNYMGRYATNSNANQPIRVPSATALRDSDDYMGPYQETFDDKDEKDEQEEQCLVDRILMNGSGYQPPDDRMFDKLRDSYDRFFPEIEIFKNDSRRKSLVEGIDDSGERSNKSYEFNRQSGENKKKPYKDRDTMQPSLISIQMKPFTSERKLSRNSILKNEIVVPRTLEVGDDKNLSLSCSGIGLQRSSISLSQPPGLYQRSKRSFAGSKAEGINIKSSINDLVGNNDKTTNATRKPTVENNHVPHTKEEFMETYIKFSSGVTRSLGRFNMIAYPDLWEQSSMMEDPEPLTETFIQNQLTTSSDSSEKTSVNSKRGRTNSLPQTKKQASKAGGAGKAAATQRPLSASSNIDSLAQNKILDDLRRIIDSEDVIEKVVYDLDEIVTESFATYNLDGSNHSNSDELELGKLNPLLSPHLVFDSQFESGNLRKVIQIRQYEYDLILSPDVNTNHHTQWFYFRVSAMETGIPYRFNIINCEKPNSQFNFGMQPLFFSVKEAVKGRGHWQRWGSEIFYYKNHFARSAATCGGNTGKSYFTCTFLIEFPNAGDVCYLAYHYPYTYTRLLTDIHMWTRQIKCSKKEDPFVADGDSKEKNQSIEFQSEADDGILFFVQELCTTILKNPVPLITITNWPRDGGDLQASQKQYVFLSSRVHPGESNASWVIKGCIDFLISDNPIATKLRDLYIFKIVPMLNPDGVINGCHRCSMSGQDLNRRWLDPCEILNPTIYHTKGLLMLLTKLGQAPLVYCDFHGHSRRKNVFMFGCSSLMSWISDDTNNPAYVDQRSEDQSYYTLPNVLNKIAQQFSIECCSFSVDKLKESTARVVVWRQFGVKRSYTMESSYCSCDQGIYKHLHINVPMLEDMGARFAEALLHIDEQSSVPVLRNMSYPASTLNSSLSEKNLSFKFDYSQSLEPKRVQSSLSQKNRINSESNIDKSVENEEDEEDEVSENEEEEEEEEEAEEESDKDNEYNDEYNAEDSD